MKTAPSLASAHAKPAASSPGLLRRAVAWSGVLLMVAMMSINGLYLGSEHWIGTAVTLIAADCWYSLHTATGRFA